MPPFPLPPNFKIIPPHVSPGDSPSTFQDILTPVLIYRSGQDEESNAEVVTVECYAPDPGENFRFSVDSRFDDVEQAQAYIRDFSSLSAAAFTKKAFDNFKTLRD